MGECCCQRDLQRRGEDNRGTGIGAAMVPLTKSLEPVAQLECVQLVKRIASFGAFADYGRKETCH